MKRLTKMKRLIGLIFILLVLTVSPSKSQNGVEKDTIIINQKENYFQVYPLSKIYEYRKYQILIDSLDKKEIYYKKIIKNKDEAIENYKKSIVVYEEVPKVLSEQISNQAVKINKLENKNSKLTIGAVLGSAIIILQTILLIK